LAGEDSALLAAAVRRFSHTLLTQAAQTAACNRCIRSNSVPLAG
jgi:hypothetical protein